MFWLLAAALAAVVAIAILAPFLRGADRAALLPAAAHDLRLYRGQLAEVDRDLARGVILPDEAGRMHAEIGRRALDADRQMQAGAVPQRGVSATAMAAVLVALSVGAFALYQRIGAPTLGDRPLALREAEAAAAYRSRPSQAEAEAAAAMRPRPAPAPEDLTLTEQLRAAVAQRPDDPQGLALLAGQEARIGNPVAAVAAQRRLIAAKGAGATGADHAALATLMVEAAGGILSPEAEAEVTQALRLTPADRQARFLQGLLLIQSRRPDRAYPIWRDLLRGAPPDAPWRALVQASMPDLAWLAGLPEPEVPEAAPLAGPTAQDAADMAALPEAERQQMIQGMVAGLESRLATEGGSPQEWARLIVALSVIGNRPRAEAILAEARGQFGASRQAIAVIEAAATQAGLP